MAYPSNNVVGTTGVLSAGVPASAPETPASDRAYVQLANESLTDPVFWGTDDTVTVDTGFPLGPAETSAPIWSPTVFVVTANGGFAVRTNEALT